MRKQIFLLSSALALLALASVPAAAQSTSSEEGKTDKNWSAPETPWGDPDLQGTWTSDDTWGVPFERPKQYGTRRFLTEDEIQQREKRVEQSQEFIDKGGPAHSPAVAELEAKEKGETPPPAQGRYGRGVDAAPVPGHWGEFARRASPLTSQVMDPEDGHIPPITPEAAKLLAEKQEMRRKQDSYVDWSLYDRCITRGIAGSIIPVIYGNGLEIVQAPGYVSIRYEMVHDVRIIPLGDKLEHAGSGYRSYMGDAIGHWEGNTLVVDTTNFLGKTAIGVNGDFGPPTSEALHTTERFTRTGTNTIDYKMTVDDPFTYTAPWSYEFPITHEAGYQLFEYACHEGNMAMRNMLSTARMEEAKKAAAAAKQ
ncbi:MAG TPA: hypothetical protein VMU80_10600 [Bryobacteraceae bacterium]|nr:hypothetical protein [Bryobacteraceae bacterium]HUO29659.1 hypothetical protein [Bryobacteraceae bacterium]